MFSINDGGKLTKRARPSIRQIQDDILYAVAEGIEVMGDIVRTDTDIRNKVMAYQSLIAAGRFVMESSKVMPDENTLDVSTFTLIGSASAD